MSGQAAAATLHDQTVASGVLFKLLAFSITLGVLPIGSYFVSIKYLWDGNATYAAITAIVTANVVLVGYIIASLLEDRANAGPKPMKDTSETKKER